MLQGYVDDSGSDGRRNSYVLAGFIFEAEKWARFSDHWKSQLGRSPAIPYFKMTHAFERTGMFQGWKREIIDRKICDLLEVMEGHKPIGIASFLLWPDFRNVIKPEVNEETNTPYGLLFNMTFQLIRSYQEMVGIFPERIDVDFDEQGGAGKFAQEMYPEFKESHPVEIRKMFGRVPLMLDDEEVMPLQAADMLAWNVRRHLDPNCEHEQYGWLYERLDRLVRGRMRYDEEDLKTVVRFRHNPPV